MKMNPAQKRSECILFSFECLFFNFINFSTPNNLVVAVSEKTIYGVDAPSVTTYIYLEL